MGTPNYQAPEMLRTHREEAPGYTMAADWWSYGVLVYEVSDRARPGVRVQHQLHVGTVQYSIVLLRC